MIKSYIESGDRLQFTWKQELYNEQEELCSKAAVKGCFIKNGKPSRISPEILEVFLSYT